MKIFEVTTIKLRLRLVPAHVAVIKGKVKINTSQFERTGEYDCSACNGTGRTRSGEYACTSCNGRGKVWGAEPRGNPPSFEIIATNFDYFKRILDFKVYDGVIFEKQIPIIRNNILDFLDSDLSDLDQPAVDQATKPKVEIGKNGLTTIIPQRLRKLEKKKETVIAKVKEFDQFLAAIQKITNASIVIKDA
jgi:hypothetical protein